MKKVVNPKLTVLMPVYNGSSYLREAIDSILAQTFEDFELLIVDDGSTDGSADIVVTYNDPRIRLVIQPINRGLVAALNMGLEISNSEYVARMDSDDICLPNRLARQVAFMDKNPSVGISGTWMESFGLGKPAMWRSPLTHEMIICNMLFESAIYHPTAIFRRSVIIENNLFYDSSYIHAEDYELWCRFATRIKFANIGEVLLRYRIHSQSVGQSQRDAKLLSASKVRNLWLKQLGLDNSVSIHNLLGEWEIVAKMSFLRQAESWLLELINANAVMNVFPEPFFSEAIAERWGTLCRNSTRIGVDSFSYYSSSTLCKYGKLSKYDLFVFFVRSLFKRGK